MASEQEFVIFTTASLLLFRLHYETLESFNASMVTPYS